MRLGPVARRVLPAGWCVLACLAPCAALQAAPGYQYFRVGHPNDVTATPTGGLALMGGGLDSQTAFLVLPDGSGTLEGPPATRVAYFFTTPGAPEVCQPRTPLTYRDLTVFKATGNAGFDLSDWNGSGGTTYTVSAEAGVLTSTQPGGNPY